jgi:hypothetical protein
MREPVAYEVAWLHFLQRLSWRLTRPPHRLHVPNLFLR